MLISHQKTGLTEISQPLEIIGAGGRNRTDTSARLGGF